MQDLLKYVGKGKKGKSPLNVETSNGGLEKSFPNKVEVNDVTETAEEKAIRKAKERVGFNNKSLKSTKPATKTDERQIIRKSNEGKKLMNLSYYKNNIRQFLYDYVLIGKGKNLIPFNISGGFPFLDRWPDKVMNFNECHEFVLAIRKWIVNLNDDAKQDFMEFINHTSEDSVDYVKKISDKLLKSYQDYCEQQEVKSYI